MSDAERTRHAIDAGATGDKVRGPDLAAAPLGTDDEASGHRPQSASPPPYPGDRITDGDSDIALYEPRSEEDNRAPADAPPSWRTWAFVGLGLLVLGVAAASLSS